MRTLREMLAGRPVYTIAVGQSVREAARLMAVRQVSSLAVVSGPRLVGIVTERDLVQRLLAADLDADQTPVSDIMSGALVLATPDDTYEDALGRMKRNRVRHLLVVDEGHLVGVVSLRDLLLVDVVEKSQEIELLTSYIYAIPPGAPPDEPAA